MLLDELLESVIMAAHALNEKDASKSLDEAEGDEEKGDFDEFNKYIDRIVKNSKSLEDLLKKDLGDSEDAKSVLLPFESTRVFLLEIQELIANPKTDFQDPKNKNAEKINSTLQNFMVNLVSLRRGLESLAEWSKGLDKIGIKKSQFNKLFGSDQKESMLHKSSLASLLLEIKGPEEYPNGSIAKAIANLANFEANLKDVFEKDGREHKLVINYFKKLDDNIGKLKKTLGNQKALESEINKFFKTRPGQGIIATAWSFAKSMIASFFKPTPVKDGTILNSDQAMGTIQDPSGLLFLSPGKIIDINEKVNAGLKDMKKNVSIVRDMVAFGGKDSDRIQAYIKDNEIEADDYLEDLDPKIDWDKKQDYKKLKAAMISSDYYGESYQVQKNLIHKNTMQNLLFEDAEEFVDLWNEFLSQGNNITQKTKKAGTLLFPKLSKDYDWNQETQNWEKKKESDMAFPEDGLYPTGKDEEQEKLIRRIEAGEDIGPEEQKEVEEIDDEAVFEKQELAQAIIDDGENDIEDDDLANKIADILTLGNNEVLLSAVIRDREKVNTALKDANIPYAMNPIKDEDGNDVGISLIKLEDEPESGVNLPIPSGEFNDPNAALNAIDDSGLGDGLSNQERDTVASVMVGVSQEKTTPEEANNELSGTGFGIRTTTGKPPELVEEEINLNVTSAEAEKLYRDIIIEPASDKSGTGLPTPDKINEFNKAYKESNATIMVQVGNDPKEYKLKGLIPGDDDTEGFVFELDGMQKTVSAEKILIIDSLGKKSRAAPIYDKEWSKEQGAEGNKRVIEYLEPMVGKGVLFIDRDGKQKPVNIEGLMIPGDGYVEKFKTIRGEDPTPRAKSFLEKQEDAGRVVVVFKDPTDEKAFLAKPIDAGSIADAKQHFKVVTGSKESGGVSKKKFKELFSKQSKKQLDDLEYKYTDKDGSKLTYTMGASLAKHLPKAIADATGKKLTESRLIHRSSLSSLLIEASVFDKIFDGFYNSYTAKISDKSKQSPLFEKEGLKKYLRGIFEREELKSVMKDLGVEDVFSGGTDDKETQGASSNTDINVPKKGLPTDKMAQELEDAGVEDPSTIVGQMDSNKDEIVSTEEAEAFAQNDSTTTAKSEKDGGTNLTMGPPSEQSDSDTKISRKTDLKDFSADEQDTIELALGEILKGDIVTESSLHRLGLGILLENKANDFVEQLFDSGLPPEQVQAIVKKIKDNKDLSDKLKKLGIDMEETSEKSIAGVTIRPKFMDLINKKKQMFGKQSTQRDPADDGVKGLKGSKLVQKMFADPTHLDTFEKAYNYVARKTVKAPIFPEGKRRPKSKLIHKRSLTESLFSDDD